MSKSKKKPAAKRKKGGGLSSVKQALFVTVFLAALLLPGVIYLILMLGVFRAPDSPWIMLGLIGAFLIGIGGILLFSHCMDHDFGWKPPVAFFGIGAVLIAAASLLMFHPTLYARIDQEMVSYVFITVALLAFSFIFYMLLFRFTLDSWLENSKKLSRNKIRKRKVGWKNYWWYEALHREFGLGVLYGMNKLYTVFFAAALVLTLLAGYARPMSIPICVCFAAVSLLTAVMTAFSLARNNKEEHGSYIVLLARNHRKGIDSVFFDLIVVLFVLVMGYVHIMLTAQLWGITLPHL